MINHVFSVYDEKAQAFLPTFTLRTVPEAIRAITDCVNDVNHNFSRHASDYTLFTIAKFDDSTGEMISEKTPLGCLVEYKTQLEIPDTQLKLVEDN